MRARMHACIHTHRDYFPKMNTVDSPIPWTSLPCVWALLSTEVPVFPRFEVGCVEQMWMLMTHKVKSWKYHTHLLCSPGGLAPDTQMPDCEEAQSTPHEGLSSRLMGITSHQGNRYRQLKTPLPPAQRLFSSSESPHTTEQRPSQLCTVWTE